MVTAVLDASAILASLLREPGYDRVDAVLKGSAISTVNLGEVVAYFAKRDETPENIRDILADLPIEVVDFTEDLAFRVGLLVLATRPAGLSFADRACLALAAKLGARALTADRPWSRIADAVGVEIELIR